MRRSVNPADWRARLGATLVFGLIALGLLNVGLYGWLAPVQPAPPPPQLTAIPAATAAPIEAPPLPNSDITYQADFSGALNDSGWLPFAGDWAIEAGSLVQRSLESGDLGIGYKATYADYALSVTLQHRQGTGGGVLFNMPKPDSVAGSQMVRFTDDGAGIFWGSFDERGVFTGQGFAAVGAPSDGPRRIEIRSGPDRYSFSLNDKQIVADVPLTSSQGGIGLISVGSVVAFSDITVRPIGVAAAAPAAPTAIISDTSGLDSLVAVSGDWAREGDAIVQRASETTDFTTATGVAAERYTLSISIEFPERAPPDVGGGVVFQMPTRTDRAGAAMVRFSNGGSAIFWGRYDADGVFQGVGGADLGGVAATRTLGLTVRAGSFDLSVDGRVIAKDVPLEAQGGYIGLISYRGPVRFRAFQLSLGV
jgi:hypothetical protein